VDDTTMLATNFNSYFDVDLAVGAQQDILGQILGVSRVLDFQPSADPAVLDDTTYRLILKVRIAKNQWTGKIQDIYNMFAALFPGTVYLIFTDNQDMTCDVLVIGLSSTLEQELITHDYIVPRPEGVQYSFAYPANKIFAYGLDNDIFGGYGEGYWLSLA